MIGAHFYRKWVPGMNSGNTPPKPIESSCVLYNNDPSQQTVNVRANCDKISCDDEASTILGEYPNNTAIRVNREIKVKARKNFYWMQIVIVGSGEVAWVASSKIRCN